MVMLEFVTSKALTRETCEIIKVRMLSVNFLLHVTVVEIHTIMNCEEDNDAFLLLLLLLQNLFVDLLVQEFDQAAYDVMSAAGVYIIGRLPAAVFREQYVPTLHELVGAEQLASGHEEMCELFARTLALKVSAIFSVCLFLMCVCKTLHSFINILSWHHVPCFSGIRKVFWLQMQLLKP